MIDHLLLLILRCPACVRAAGKLIATAAFTAIMSGWRGHRVLAILDHRLARAGTEGAQSLAELYPSLPTWWIPESAGGYTFYLLAMAAGLGVSMAANRIESTLR